MNRHFRALVSTRERPSSGNPRAGQRRLGFDSLERRELMARDAGTNIPFINYYSTQDMFANVIDMSYDQWIVGKLPSFGFPQQDLQALTKPIGISFSPGVGVPLL
jgi:hypothetical protein